ncbi:DMT family transporter [Terribacillus saccharophilus]|uniref:EamA domain-containing protein n=1 Tax=Terribacillus saccharophilus TaxID=361277 RepID=A0ABX4H0U3_9BACI|nr:DMT family transporter [Terribacillus saccharophilus]PAD36315.1 hypothetical protein CHH56_04800 [Terribacillus saccharophilus]PAD95043.1 hypothetical protein CHH50_15685 [Terribacillus saccharophilus]PAE00734.1 hypothetical protein CHH48_05505 [Terribacillus saccharophilus]
MVEPVRDRLRMNHTKAIFLAIFVTFLWSTSWVFIKYGLEEIPPILYAGLRYGIAAICLLPFLLIRKNLKSLKQLKIKDFILIAILGVFHYTLTQGAQFVALKYLPASTVTLMLNFTTVLVALFSISFLNEKLNSIKWVGIGINVAGIVIFFAANNEFNAQLIGIFIAAFGVLFNAISSILGRSINRKKNSPPVVITCLSMIVGSILLFVTSYIRGEQLPSLGMSEWSIIVWLAVINTALAFTLWNISLRELTAAESSITTNTMPIQITIMVSIFYGESISPIEIVGILITCLGTFLVQFNFKSKTKKSKQVIPLSNEKRKVL